MGLQKMQTFFARFCVDLLKGILRAEKPLAPPCRTITDDLTTSRRTRSSRDRVRKKQTILLAKPMRPLYSDGYRR
jgi:hypothetical protein